MKQKRPVIKRCRDIEDLHHLRLMTLLREVVGDLWIQGRGAGSEDRPADGDLQRKVGPADPPGA